MKGKEYYPITSSVEGRLREASLRRDEPEAAIGDAVATSGGVAKRSNPPAALVRRPRADLASPHSGCFGTPPWDHYESCAGSLAR
jgi:hypothetical protein